MILTSLSRIIPSESVFDENPLEVLCGECFPRFALRVVLLSHVDYRLPAAVTENLSFPFKNKNFLTRLFHV